MVFNNEDIIAKLGNHVKNKMDDMGNLGERIKFVRVRLGLNQSEFAEKLRLSGPTAVSKYEKGQREPDIATLKKIASLGNKSLDWLLTGEEVHKEKEPEARDPKLVPLIEKLETIYREGDFDVKARLRGTIEELYDEALKSEDRVSKKGA